jgi:hypothetical protein
MAQNVPIIVPRNFKLLEEVNSIFVSKIKLVLLVYIFLSFYQLEASEKGAGDMSVSLGLVEPDDIYLTEWQGSILGPGGVS